MPSKLDINPQKDDSTILDHHIKALNFNIKNQNITYDNSFIDQFSSRFFLTRTDLDNKSIIVKEDIILN